MKYIIDLPEEFAEATKEYWDKTVGLQLEPYTELNQQAVKDAQEKAWELASAIVCPSDCNVGSIQKHCKEIFGVNIWEIRDIFTNNTYQEAKAKYESWMKQKDEIHVGDEVITDDGLSNGFVTRIDEYKDANVVWEMGGTGCFDVALLHKTGRHFDEVAELLEKMRGEDNETE